MSAPQSALTCYLLDDGTLPIDKHWDENRGRPIALGRKNGLFPGSARAYRRVTSVMSLTSNDRLDGHDLNVYFRDVLRRLPLTLVRYLKALPPHRWTPANTSLLH